MILMYIGWWTKWIPLLAEFASAWTIRFLDLHRFPLKTKHRKLDETELAPIANNWPWGLLRWLRSASVNGQCGHCTMRPILPRDTVPRYGIKIRSSTRASWELLLCPRNFWLWGGLLLCQSWQQPPWSKSIGRIGVACATAPTLHLIWCGWTALGRLGCLVPWAKLATMFGKFVGSLFHARCRWFTLMTCMALVLAREVQVFVGVATGVRTGGHAVWIPQVHKGVLFRACWFSHELPQGWSWHFH